MRFLPLLLLTFLGCDTGPDPARVPDVTNSIGMEFRRIEPGSFSMGSPETDPLREADETPAHPVTITRPYHLGLYEVTQAQYAEVMGTNPAYFSPDGDGSEMVRGLDTREFPIERVSWFDAVAFCKKLSNRPEEIAAGHRYRLPTEAEWEYACRAGTETRFVWGNEVDLEQANYLGSGFERTRRVGSYAPNGFGLFDMHGNVLEWCADWHDENYYTSSPETDPTGPEQSPEAKRVLRGGGYGFTPASSSFRDNINPYLKTPSHGFRVVLEIDTGDNKPAADDE